MKEIKIRKNKTYGERAIEIICKGADISFEEFCEIIDESNEKSKIPRIKNRNSYEKHMNSYVEKINIPKEKWIDIFNFIKSPKKYSDF